MKAEHMTIIVAASAAAGAWVESSSPVAKSVPFLNSLPYADAILGVAIAAAGYFTHYSVVSDAVEGFGIGYALGAIL